MVPKLLCCTDNLLVLPVCGVFMTLLGLVLLIIYLVARGITSSLHLVDAPIPTYLAALLTIALGVFLIILLKRRHVILIILSILLSVVDLIVCIVHAVTAALVSIPFLASFSVCVLRATSSECQCYILGEGNTNSTVIVPGDGTKHYTFLDAKSCGSIEMSLKDFLYTLSIVYSFGAIGCVVSGTLSTLLLCSSRRSFKDEVEEEGVPSREERRNQQTIQHEEESQGRNSVAQRSLDRATSQRTPVRSGSETVALVTPQGARSQRDVGITPESRPVRRSASVTTPTHATSISAAVTPSSYTRPAIRSHSVARSSGESGARQRPRLPVLVRGGYLQSHVNGPRIPIYMVHGSNESYIALTDLPKLQLPALNQVPAYVRELPDLPNYEPPPYSPTAETFSESPERADTEQPSQSPPARQCLFEEDAVSAQNELQELELQFTMQNDSSRTEGDQLSGNSGDGELEGDSGDDQIPLGTDGAVGTSDSLNGDLQENTIDPNQLTPQGTDETTIHEAVQEASRNRSDAGIVNPVFEEEETDIVEDINRPPDILLEAIESARSSINTSAHFLDASTNSTAQDDAFQNHNVIDPPRSTSTVRISGSISNERTIDSQAVVTLRTTSEPKQDVKVNQQKCVNHSERLSRARHPSRTTNLQEHSVEPQQRPTGPSNNQARGEPLETSLNNHSQSTDARSKEVKRSRSLSAAKNIGPEYSLQEIPSRSNKSKRHSETYGRQRKYEYGTKTKDHTYLPEDRNNGMRYNPATTQTKVSPDRARRRSRDHSRPRQPGVSSGENLSDIINLVEAVHHGSPSVKHSTKKKKKKRESSRKDNVVESRI